MTFGRWGEVTLSTFLPVPAIGAQFFFGQADGLHQVLQALVFERCQVELPPDLLKSGTK